MRYSLPIAALILSACGQAGAVSDAQERQEGTAQSTAQRPIVVELYQSQGCSSCPPANANLNAIANDPSLIPLSFSVTYWDRLGWKDTFAKAEFTQRQRDYAMANGRANVATPQMIVEGHRFINGGNRRVVDATIAKAKKAAAGPKVRFADGKVTIGKGIAKGTAMVWLVRYDPRIRNVPIKAGENGGRTLPHRNIVRELSSLGRWSGGPRTFMLPKPTDPTYRTVVLVQKDKAGPIIGAGRL